MSAVMQRESAAEPDVGALAAAQRPGYALTHDFYHSPAVFRRDMERIFHRHWLCAGHASQAPNPGDFFTVQVGPESVIIARGKDGALHALLNVCRHRGAEVCDRATGNTSFFVCPYHAWTYGLDGALEAARHMPPEFDRAAHGLRRLHMRDVQGLVFFTFADQPIGFGHVERTLHASMGRYGWADAKVAERRTYEVDANWKLAVENYVECYHCSPSHPEYSKLHALEQPLPRIQAMNARMMERTRALGFEVGTHTQFGPAAQGEAIDCFRYALYEGVRTGSEDGGPVAPLMGAFTDYDGGATSFHCGPASFLLAYPDHGLIYRFWPRTEQTCAMELIWLVRGDAVEGRDYRLDRLTWLWEVTTQADKKIIEHTARGVRSAFYVPGPLAPMEYNERRYVNWYLNEIA